jgi:rubrerythrin
VDDFATAAASLAGLDALDVEGLKLMYRVETAGEEFYERLAAGIDNAEVAELFRRNGKEEKGHARRIGRMLELKLGQPYAPTGHDAEPMAVAVPDPLPLEMLPYIVQGEIAGDAGYQRWADNEPDPEVAKLLRLNGREETIHSKRVEQALALLHA